MEGTRTVVGKGRDEDEDVDVALAAFEKKIDKTDPEQVKVSEEKKRGAYLSLSLSVCDDASRDEGDGFIPDVNRTLDLSHAFAMSPGSGGDPRPDAFSAQGTWGLEQAQYVS